MDISRGHSISFGGSLQGGGGNWEEEGELNYSLEISWHTQQGDFTSDWSLIHNAISQSQNAGNEH